MSEQPHIVLFDVYSSGHHRMYLELLCDYWQSAELPGTLELLVTCEFETRHPAFCSRVRSHQSPRLKLSTVEIKYLNENPKNLLTVIRNDILSGRVIGRHIKRYSPDHILLLYFDHCQFSLASRVIQKTSVSGIYFRASLHYSPEPGIRRQITRWRKRFLLALCLRNPAIKTVFCLDPDSVSTVSQIRPAVQSVALPDGYQHPVECRSRDDTRSKYHIQSERKVALFFGVISKRKGILILLEALRHLSAFNKPKLTLIIAGKPSANDRDEIADAIEKAKESQVQIVWLNYFVPDSEIGSLFAVSDFVLTPYQGHIGSSNILIRAAAAGKPVIGSDYGLVGRQIRKHRLGLAVDSSRPETLARAIDEYIETDRKESFSQELANQFVSENTAEKFAETIFQQLYQYDNSSDWGIK